MNHLLHEKKKYNRPSQKIGKKIQIAGESIIRELNTQNITLVAHTYDQFGCMGPLAERYFFESKETPTLHKPKDIKSFTKPGMEAYIKGRKLTKLSGLLHKGNKGWKLVNQEKWFGNTYQTASPSEWGKHNLAMNLNIGYTKHIRKCINKVEGDMDDQTEKNKYKIIGRHSLMSNREYNPAVKGIEKERKKDKRTVTNNRSELEPVHTTTGKEDYKALYDAVFNCSNIATTNTVHINSWLI